MGKANAYSLFVFDTAKKRRAQGIEVNQSFLFKELDSEWRNLPDEVKERYKQRAKGSTTQSSATFAEKREKAFANDFKRQQVERPHCPADIKTVIKPDPDAPREPTPSSSIGETKANIREIKEEIMRGIKRAREEEANDARQEPKVKIRPGIPNWKNIKDKSTVEPVKYLQKNLYEMRETCLSILRARNDKSLKIPIYAFSVNVLCKQKKDGQITFVPLEIAIYTYSIETGNFCEPYHVIINSGPIPGGCLNLSHDHANLTHKIPIPKRTNDTSSYPDCARSDIRKIYEEMLEYTKEGERTLLIENNYHMPQILGSLDWLYKKASESPGAKLPKASSWTVMPIAEFVAGLTNSVKVELLGEPQPELGIHYYLKQLQDCSIYDYNHNFMCEFHTIEEYRCRFCAQNVAQRMIMNLQPAFEKIRNNFKAYQVKNMEMLEPPAEKPALIYPDVIPPISDNVEGSQLQLPSSQNDQPMYAIESGAMPLVDPRLVIPKVEPDTIISLGEDSEFVVEKVPEPVKPKKKESLIFASTPACTGNPKYF